jgi:hypothetical protein
MEVYAYVSFYPNSSVLLSHGSEAGFTQPCCARQEAHEFHSCGSFDFATLRSG